MEVNRDLVDRLDRRGRPDRRDAAADARTAGLTRRLSRLQRDAGPAVVLVAFAVVVSQAMASVLAQDGWLSLVGGREIVRHGLPSTDHLTVWSAGTEWVDQQWLGHLGLYALYAIGGVRFLLVVHVLLAIATFALALAAARRLGGSPRSTAVVGAVALVPVLSTISELRTQLAGSALFVLVLWLLAAEAEAPSRRVYLVLPLLVVWANVHGSVVLGAALATISGLLLVARQRRWSLRAAVLVVAPAACVLATPYGLSLFGYYHRTLFNREFGRVVTEWHAVTLKAENIPLFLLLAGGLWLLGRAGAGVGALERAAFLLTGVAALTAERNVGFAGLTALVVLPRLLDAAVPPRPRRTDAPVRLGLVLASVVGCALTLAALAASPAATLAEHYPPGLRAAVARGLAADPQATVFADVRYADWLLWTIPAARGRVMFDARFELLSDGRLESLFRWANESTDEWRAAARGSSLVVAWRRHEPHKAAALVRTGGRIVYSTPEVAVVRLEP